MKFVLQIDLSRRGVFVLVNPGSNGRGLVIKPARCMMWSEREGNWRGFRIGPLYFRTFAKRVSA